jgi:hypothetical protein
VIAATFSRTAKIETAAAKSAIFTPTENAACPMTKYRKTSESFLFFTPQRRAEGIVVDIRLAREITLGNTMAEDQFDEFFRRMMKHFFKDFESIEKDFRLPKAPASKPRGWIVKTPGGTVGGGGFSISINSDGREPPKIEVRRFGPSGKWEKVPLEPKRIATVVPRPERRLMRAPAKEALLPRPRESVIPEYRVSIDSSEVTIVMNAEGVESPGDVKLRFYPESVEVYASARKLDRQYFCTVALPAGIDRSDPKVRVEKGKVIIAISRKIQAP